MCDCKCNSKKTSITDCIVILGFLAMGTYLAFTFMTGEPQHSHSVEAHSMADHE